MSVAQEWALLLLVLGANDVFVLKFLVCYIISYSGKRPNRASVDCFLVLVQQYEYEVQVSRCPRCS